VTKRYALEQVNQGYEDLLAGRIMRGMIVFWQVHQHRYVVPRNGTSLRGTTLDRQEADHG
jgi:hypothetical protein